MSWAGGNFARTLASRCREAGLDLAAFLSIGWYNDSVEERLRLPDFGNPQALAVLIGNTRALWPHLLDALCVDPTLLADANPVETYTMRHVRAAVARLEVPYDIHWAHVVTPSPIAIQRLAHVAGLARLVPSNLSVHPTYGPWISLRAVLVADVTGPPGPPPAASNQCDDCEHACLAALRQATAEPDDWRRWLAIRDACPVGRSHRYDELQIRYHYTKDREALRCAVKERLAGRGASGR